MHYRPNLKSNTITFLLFCFFPLVLLSQIACAQSPTEAHEEFDKLAQAYHSDRIFEDKYLDSTYSLTQQLLNEGIEFKTRELVNLLSLYKEIAWGKKEYARQRVNYYMALSDNATMFGETGAAMYYSEKVSKELAVNGRIRPLMVDAFKIHPLTEQGLNDEIIAIYMRHKAYIQQLPEQLLNKKTDNVNGMFAIDILSAAMDSYIKTKDTAAIYQASLVADQISTELKRKYPISPDHMLYNDFHMLSRQHSIALFEGDQTKAGMLLDSLKALTITYKDQPTVYIEIPISQWKVDHYLTIKNLDSARFYIKKLESLPNFFKSQEPVLDEYKAKLQTIQGDFQGGFTLLTNALANERKAKSALMTEVDNLLYAYTEAENSKIDLQEAEKVKEQRTTWLLIISLAAAIIVLAIYLTMLNRSRKSKAQIEALNETANIQIIAMEEMKHEAVREEQQRLGQDLHDGLSSSIASIKHQLEILSIETEDTRLKNKLGMLQTQVTNAYEAARNKSHEWFNTADGQHELSFEQRIKLLTDTALPDTSYEKAIHIDDDALKHISLDTRIALLRIIQEAITNILKHAKAQKVDILIYEEVDSLIMTIKDDGTGLKNKNIDMGNSTLGLQSIKRRVLYLNGKIEINSDAQGTELAISIPLKSMRLSHK